MKLIRTFFFLANILLAVGVLVAENAAPSMHFVYNYPSADAILKMQKIKIVKSAYASYFEVNNFTNGYCGLQQTSDPSFGKSNVFIASLWDTNTVGGIYSVVEYKDPQTFSGRFGGEGDGYKTINPYDWKLNTWYNIVNRAWKLNGKLYIATFINDLSTNKWFHTSTLSIPDPNKYLTAYNDAFMENWNGGDASCDGRYIRQAFFKDCWNINTAGTWEKNTSVNFSANSSTADVTRNGIYHNSFDAYYDATENAYCMQHGGNTTRSAAFNNGRTVSLSLQTNQGSSPTLTTGAISSLTASNSTGVTSVNWVMDELKSPQLSSKVEIIDALGKVVLILQDTMPQRRSFTSNTVLSFGDYTARLTTKDIFNQVSAPVTTGFSVTNAYYLTVSANALSFPSLSNTKKIELTSNTPWTATSDQSWLTVSVGSGSGNASISLTATENTDLTAKRTATVTVTGDNVPTQKIVVTQSETEVWYYVLNQRGWTSGAPLTTTAMTGTALGVELTAGTPEYNNYAQQWKIVKLPAPDESQLINRLTNLSIDGSCKANNPSDNFSWHLQTASGSKAFPGYRIISKGGTVGIHAASGRVFPYNVEVAECFWVMIKPVDMPFKQPTSPIEYSNDSKTVWYTIKTPGRTGTNYLTNNGSNAAVTGSDFIAGNDALLWKVIDLGNGMVNIINKSNLGQIKIPAANNTSIPTVASDQIWTLKYQDQEQYTINSGVFQLHLASGRNLVAYPNSALGDASCWIFTKVSSTPVTTQTADRIKVYASKGIIQVLGTDSKPQVYTSTGQKMDALHVLPQGVYIVRVAGTSNKVIVD